MNAFQAVIADLNKQVYRRGVNYSLDALRDALIHLGNPHLKLKNVIHIAGTNGKGSTVAFLQHGLTRLGYSTGTFTSPHLECYTERLSLNGVPISKPAFTRLYQTLKCNPHLPDLTEFEILTIMSFLYFVEKKPDFIIYETGLGGRLDATNVISPVLCIITSLSLDHTDVLGSTLVEIAREKAGIIKSHTPIISAIQPPECQAILKYTAQKNKTEIRFISPVKNIPDSFLLSADYQKQNLALAYNCLKTIKKANSASMPQLDITLFEKASIWGRYTVIKEDSMTRVIDGAHNLAGVSNLIQQLARSYQPSDVTFVLGILKRKNYRQLLPEIFSFNENIHFVVDFMPGESINEKNIQALNTGFRVKQASVKEILTLKPSPVIVYTGSLYFISLLKPISWNQIS